MQVGYDVNQTFSWDAAGLVPEPASVRYIRSCSFPNGTSLCSGSVKAANFNLFSDPTESPPVAATYSQWIYIDIYYPEEHSFDFHFAEPPGGSVPVPVNFTAIDDRADNTVVGGPYTFSLILDPKGTSEIVSASDNFSLTRQAAAPTVPESATLWLLLNGGWFVCRRRCRQRRLQGQRDPFRKSHSAAPSQPGG